ncbi:MAG: carbohydrate ABC transporter permease [Lachnospiraceae bacterium]|jgi:multiple sugar transport system permease protein/putative aldouronate transport system permease protein|nr:carbohydrate ABC transporter permease [Lachnospiraceae bacterium]MCI9202731.1 carbohydrate ABC transporter permease [Lachnospiraceae bacterium]
MTGCDLVFYGVSALVIGILTLTVLYIIVYILSASFSSPAALAAGKVVLWPVDFSVDGYKAVFNYSKVWIGYRNTIFYVIVGTAINVSMTLLCAYPMAQKDLYGGKAIMAYFTFTMIFNGGMIPTYILVKNLGIMNTVWSLLIPGAMTVYNMIIARTFIRTNIPGELRDAARIDGCDDFHFFFEVVLPLSKAIIAVLTLWYAVGHWNSYMDAFLYLRDNKLYPLQIFLKDVLVSGEFSAEDMMDPETAIALQNMKLLLKYSLIVVSVVPLFFFYPFVQKYFVKGVTIGSVKG